MPRSNISDLSLDELCNGQARRQLLAALEEVLFNCEDPTTNDKARTVMLKLTVTPTPERRSAQIKAEVNSKLAGSDPVASMLYIGRKGGVLQVAEAHDPNQMTIGERLDDPTPFPGGKR